MKSAYSTAELANLLRVNESTVKRWSDTGDLACVKTKGGHRRFAVATVMEFIRKNNLSASAVLLGSLPNEDLQAHVIAGNIRKLAPELKREMIAGNVLGILTILRIAFVAKPKLLDLFAELLFPPLVEIGEEWHRKSITVDQEHLATNALREALAQFHGELHRKDSNGLKAICSCPEGELHDIAIRCVNYYLETEGWNVLFLGQSTPTESLVGAIKAHKPNLVALSAIVPQHERSFINAVNNIIYPAAHRVGARLALGGPDIISRWSTRVKAEHLCSTINECAVFADPNSYMTKP
jgi:MerR family transcriptional regulator, light-induced transcriptional regulator